MAKKWIKKAIGEPGSLRAIAKKAGAIGENGNIKKSWLTSKKSALQKKAEGDKKLSKEQRELLQKILLALRLKKMPKRGNEK